jgi:drug/metabolite transporter (DMT)-like permease
LASRELIAGTALAVLTTVVWATSFPAIKVVSPVVGSYAYTWMRSAIAVAALLPFTIRSILSSSRTFLRYGLLAGISYAFGLWLQGWGTGLTTASKSAFITGLSVVFVHIYVALAERRYSLLDAAAAASSIAGLYLLTSPSSGGSLFGDILVLLGAVGWAAEIIFVSKAAGEDGSSLALTTLILIPSTAFIAADALDGDGLTRPPLWALVLLAYLGLACSDGATILQVEAQKRIRPETAAVIYLLEPVFATIISHFTLGETLTLKAAAGAVLIMTAMILAVVSEWKRQT